MLWRLLFGAWRSFRSGSVLSRSLGVYVTGVCPVLRTSSFFLEHLEDRPVAAKKVLSKKHLIH